MTKHFALTAIALALATSASTLEAGTLKVEPGQWHTVVKTQQLGQPLPAQTHTNCLTQEQVDEVAGSLAKPQNIPGENCKRTDFRETKNSVDWAYECTGQFTINNQGSIKFDSPTHHLGTLKMKGTVMGQPMEMVSTIEGQRVGACTGKESGNH